jgi:hypothetical protein
LAQASTKNVDDLKMVSHFRINALKCRTVKQRQAGSHGWTVIVRKEGPRGIPEKNIWKKDSLNQGSTTNYMAHVKSDYFDYI